MRIKDKELPFLICVPEDEVLLVIDREERNFYIVTEEVNLRKTATVKYKKPDKNRQIISSDSLEERGVFPEDLSGTGKYYLIEGLFPSKD